MKKLTFLIFFIPGLQSLNYAGTFYSQGSVAPELTVSWNDNRLGGGNAPNNFTSGDIFVVQNGHLMASNASWSISGTGSKLWIENGGNLTANFPVTLAKATSLQIDDGGVYIHNNTGSPSSTIFNGTESFSPNSTFWIKNWIGNLYVIPYGITWGNLIIDVPVLTGSWNQVGNVAVVNGTLDIRQTGGNQNEFRLCSRNNNTYQFNIANINVSGGILNIQGGGTSGVPTMNMFVSGILTVTGGKLDFGTNGTSVLNLSGNLNVSGTGILVTSGATSKIIFNNTGVQNIYLASGAMNTTLINADINQGCSVTMNSTWELSPLSTINIYGSLNTNNYTFKPRAVNVGGVLNLGAGILEQQGTAAIIVGGASLGNTGTINCSGVINMSATSFSSFLVQPGGVVNLDNGVVNMNHNMSSFFIDTGGTLNCGTGTVASINSTTSAFIINPMGTLEIGSPEGICLTGSCGNIQVGGSRSYHFGANYCYSGTTAQVTGNGLPSSVNDLTINNGAGVNLTNDLQVKGTLRMVSGVIHSQGKSLSYGESGILEYNGSMYETTTDAEFPPLGGPGSVIINNSAPSGIFLHASRVLSGSLTIAALAKFVVPAEICLTVNSSVTIHGSNGLEVMSEGSFIDDGVLSGGNGTVRIGKDLEANGWHYISSPVQAASAGTFLGDYVKPYAEGTLGFGPYIISPATLLKQVQGYALWPALDHTISFSDGRLNTGSLEAVISRTYTGLSGDNEFDGWNLVGNPYPCSVDLDMLHETWENAEETAYFWDPSPEGGNYLVYPAKAGFGTHSQYVPPMQGFFVRCNAPASNENPGFGNIRFNNTAKVHSSVPFLKEREKLSDALFAKITGSENRYSDEMIVHFDSTATEGFDPGYDALKLWGMNEAPQLYSTTGDQKKVTVNVRPFDKPTILVPVGFTTDVPSRYELKINSLTTFSQEVSVILEDTKLQQHQDMRLDPVYSFLYEQGDLPDRFILHFNKTNLAAREQGSLRNIKIYSYGKDIFINKLDKSEVSVSLFLYDMAGREIIHVSLRDEKTTRIQTGLGGGVYIIKAVSDGAVFTKLITLD